MNIDELAAYLHVARRHVEQLLKDGEIPCVVRGGRVLFPHDEVEAWASQRLLRLPGQSLDWYHRHTMQGTQRLLPRAALIPVLLQPDYIDLGVAAKTRAAVRRALVDLADRTGRVFDARELLDSVEAREALCSTALPGGLALLHARQHRPYRYEGSFIVLGRTLQPIPFGAPDGRASRLFFLVCCQDERIHLHTLARLCLLALKTNVLAGLLEAPDAAAAYAELVAAEQAVLPEAVAEPKNAAGKRGRKGR